MKDLINWVLRELSDRIKPTPPPIGVDAITRKFLSEFVKSRGIPSAYYFDGIYKYATLERWGVILWDVLSNIDPWTAEEWDCEDIALLVKSRISERYRLNGCALAIGNTPFGYHAWNMLMTEAGLYHLEPQTGELWKVGTGKYLTDWVLF